MTRQPVEIIGDGVLNRVWPFALFGFEPRGFPGAPTEQLTGLGLGL